MKWLGITFDSKLLFNEHVKAATNKAENIAKGLTMLGNTVRGLHQRLLLSNPGPLRTKSGRNPVKNSNEGKAGVGLGRELLGGQSRPIGYNDRSKALTPCVDSGQDRRAGTRDTEWVT